MSTVDQMIEIAERSDFICPDCGGGLWSLKNDPMHRLRCHTGHLYSEGLFQKLQSQKIEESIWVSIRMLEERVNLLKLMEQRGENHVYDPRSPL